MMETLMGRARSLYQLLGNRRKSERPGLASEITVSCKDAYGHLTKSVCSCVDVSLRGIALDSPEMIPTNSYVLLRSDPLSLNHFGVVRYCNLHGDLFRIGLEFTAEPEVWKKFTPC